MLTVTKLHAGYGPIEVLHGISLKVEKGEIVTLLGANGAGKSTTLMTLCGIFRARDGKIVFEGQDISKLSPHEIVAHGIVQAPEGRRIFPRLTVRENLEMGAFAQRDNGLDAELAQVFKLFPILQERSSQLGGTLSGGEQQMLAIGRALMAKPRLLLLDEPSLGLAPKLVAQIFHTIRKINSEGVTILLVEQNARQALSIAHRGYVMQTGQIVLEDTGANLLKSEQVKKAYLGE